MRTHTICGAALLALAPVSQAASPQTPCMPPVHVQCIPVGDVLPGSSPSVQNPPPCDSSLPLTDCIALDFPFDQRGPTRLERPVHYDGSTATPLVLLLHGLGTSSLRAECAFQLDQVLRDDRGYLLLAPDARCLNNTAAWDADSSCCASSQGGNLDTGFLYALVRKVIAGYNVDTRRVYIVGQSNGGFMAYRMARDYPKLFTAIVTVGASVEESWAPATPSRSPIHILDIHGTEDVVVKPQGGTVIGLQRYSSILDVTQKWSAWNGCDSRWKVEGPSISLAVASSGLDPDTRRLIYQNCATSNGSVRAWVIKGVGHEIAFNSDMGGRLMDYLYDKRRPGLGTETCDPMGAAPPHLGMIDVPGATDERVKLIVEGLAPSAMVTLYGDNHVVNLPAGQVGCLTSASVMLGFLQADKYGRISIESPRQSLPGGLNAGTSVFFQVVVNGSGAQSNVIGHTW